MRDLAAALKLLYPSSGSPGRCVNGRDEARLAGCRRESSIDLAGEVALEAADDLALGQALGGAAGGGGGGAGGDVVDGRLVPAHANDAGAVEGGVGLPVTAAVEPVPPVGPPGAGGDGAGAARALPLDLGHGICVYAAFCSVVGV